MFLEINESVACWFLISSETGWLLQAELQRLLWAHRRFGERQERGAAFWNWKGHPCMAREEQTIMESRCAGTWYREDRQLGSSIMGFWPPGAHFALESFPDGVAWQCCDFSLTKYRHNLPEACLEEINLISVACSRLSIKKEGSNSFCQAWIHATSISIYHSRKIGLRTTDTFLK